TGNKAVLVTRLAGAMELAAAEGILEAPRYVGLDVAPVVGMRVVHKNRGKHGSFSGLPGTIEIIPGRGAFKPDEQSTSGRGATKPDEQSASVLWDTDTRDVRGPYYTGEDVNHGSGR
ncbi:hypothetical protein T484DRAFT_1810917, partial [Baffinella frigidus]